MFTIIAVGLLLGLLIFSFFFIVSKFKNKYFLAPLLTFFTALIFAFYSLFFVGGFEGMGYVLLAGGIFAVSVLGTAVLPLLTKSARLRKVSLWDKIGLFVLPVVFVITIFAVTSSDDEYWIIDEGHAVVDSGTHSHYQVSTISEGNRQIYLRLGKEHTGKKIEVEEINQGENTEVVVHVTEDNNNPDESPFISIGIDEINEPLTVRSTEGEEFRSALEIFNNQ